MAVTPNLSLPLLDSGEKVSEDHLKINQFVEALDTRFGEVLATIAGLSEVGHSHEMAKVNGLSDALDLLASKDHGHKLDDLTDVDVEDAPDGKILQKIAGKWGLGDRSYSVPEINNIVAELASDDHKHPIADVDGLADKLAKFADVTKNAKFNHDLSVGGDIYLNNNALITGDSNGEFSDRSGNNIDHIHHDDSGKGWHFVSDNTYKSQGNSKLHAGQVNLFRNDLTTNGAQYMLRVRNHSYGQENLTANRSNSGISVENYVHAPLNGSKDNGRRFYSVGARFNAYLVSQTGYLYEVQGSASHGAHQGKSDLRYLSGASGIASTSQDAEGTVEQVWAGRSIATLEGAISKNVTGHEIRVNPNHANATVEYARGLRLAMDYDAGTVTEDPIAIFMNYDGNWSGKKKIGIYQNEVQENHLTGTTFLAGREAAVKPFVSAPQSYNSGSTSAQKASVSHGFGQVPIRIGMYLVCTSPYANYAVGDIVIPYEEYTRESAQFSTFSDSNVVGLAHRGQFLIKDKNTTSTHKAPSSSFKVILWAEK
ncbi:hypothetical protein [Pseudovibrio brasiliensis]|uniref:Tail fiber protein n=1 Tax=Pseudovibrio brasiliensis TaxID=1898042 RepID=A0ABX8AVX4_9HYPH|nr:hypothetical protein [Pseudovibrio brasiliensis]QUS59212.1 hypothetical protein KGB56_26885 [Pseudovibrio brasiliensis]